MFFFWCIFSPKGSRKLGAMKGIKGKKTLQKLMATPKITKLLTSHCNH